MRYGFANNASWEDRMEDRTHWSFVHNLAEGADWTPGLREIFEYRDLGIKEGTRGDYVAHVIRHNGKEQSRTCHNQQCWPDKFSHTTLLCRSTVQLRIPQTSRSQFGRLPCSCVRRHTHQ